MRPEIQAVLRQAGLKKDRVNENPDGEGTLSDRLSQAGMSLDEGLEQLVHVAQNSANESLRLSALDRVLKIHGALKETAPQAPSFTIVIQEGGGAIDNKIQGVNPILLPRQLLKQLDEQEGKVS
jgi:hypothetical protein